MMLPEDVKRCQALRRRESPGLSMRALRNDDLEETPRRLVAGAACHGGKLGALLRAQGLGEVEKGRRRFLLEGEAIGSDLGTELADEIVIGVGLGNLGPDPIDQRLV